MTDGEIIEILNRRDKSIKSLLESQMKMLKSLRLAWAMIMDLRKELVLHQLKKEDQDE